MILTHSYLLCLAQCLAQYSNNKEYSNMFCFPGEVERMFPSARSFPKRSSWEWAMSKPGAWNSIRVSPTGGGKPII